ncbi:MAG: alpha/beta fold hydrolase [Chloroflexota bacterium]
MKPKHILAVILMSLVLLLAACAEKATPTPLPTATQPPSATPTPEPSATPLPTATPTAEPSPPAYEPIFEAAGCPFQLPAGQVESETVRCGYLILPENRSDPNSRDIRLAVAIFGPTAGAAAADPILYLSGGPGGSVLEYLYLAFSRFEPLLTLGRELILFDQRGVGFSQPALDCPAVLELGLELLDEELDGRPLADPEMSELNLEALLACEADLLAVADLTTYNTLANAADINDLRLALGYDQMNLWGASYGTRLALEVMRDFPEGLRSVVLDSVYPPDIDLYLEGPVNLDRSMDLLFESCASDTACNAAYPNLRTVFFETVERLNETPLPSQVIDPFTGQRYDAVFDGDSLLGLTFRLLYETDVLPSLPQLIYAVSQDDLSLAELIRGQLLAQADAMSQGMQFSVQCNEEFAFNTLEDFQAVVASYPELAPVYGDSAVGELAFRVCQDWDSGVADARENEPVISDVPTLLMAGQYDPITPPAWARHTAQTLANGHLFEYPGVGHGASIVLGCPQAMMQAFIDDPTRAPDDACIDALGLQFQVPETGAVVIQLEPLTNETMGIESVAPAGWTEVSPGVYSRANSALDVTVAIVQAAPTTTDALVQMLVMQLGLSEAPEVASLREANGLTWTLYTAQVQGFTVDAALAQSGELALVVLLQSAASERDALYEAVFLPMIDATVPLD